jgi:hypothetical protein
MAPFESAWSLTFYAILIDIAICRCLPRGFMLKTDSKMVDEAGSDSTIQIERGSQ